VPVLVKAHAERAARAQNELRSSFHHAFLRSGAQLGDAALSSGPRSPCATLAGAGARGPAYDKERAERLSAAAVAVATDFAAGFK